MTPEVQSVSLAVGIGISLLLALTYALRSLRRSLLEDWALGFSLLIFAVALLYPLIGENSEIVLRPVRFGFSIGFWGIGIIQLASAARITFGRQG